MKRSIAPFVIIFIAVKFAQSFSQPSLTTQTQKQMVMANLPSRPLAFTENRGQWNEKALFKADASGATFQFCRDEIAMVFTRDAEELIDDVMPKMPKGMPDKFNHPRYKKESIAIHAKFIGANPDAQVVPQDRLSYNCNYFLGNIPSKWATDCTAPH